MSELFSLVAEHAPLVIWRIDRDGIFTMSRGRGLHALGFTEDQLIGRSVYEIYRDHPQVLSVVRDALEGVEQQRLVEVRGVYFDSWVCPLFDSVGKVSGAFGVASDVTSRVRAEDLERSSSERFLKAFHASPAGIMVSDLATGRIIDVNEALCRIGGYEREQLVGLTTVEAGFWPDYESRAKAIRNALENRGPSQFDYKLPTRAGRFLRVKMLVEVIELDGRPCALSIIHGDRRRQRALKALQQTRKRYQTLARFAPVGIFHAGPNGELTYINEQFCGLFELPSQELLGRGWWSAVLETDRAHLEEQWDAAVAQRQPLTSEFQIRRHLDPHWLLLQVEPESDMQGFVGSVTDISRRKRAELELQEANNRLEENVRIRTELLMRASKTLEEQIFERRRTYEELEKSEMRWRSLVEEAPDVILLVDREGKIDYINHTGLRPELGPANVIGRSVYDLVYAEHEQEIREVLSRVFDHGQSVTHEVRGPGDQVEPRWFQSHLAPIKYLGNVIGATAIVRDVTEQRTASENLRRTQDQLAHAGRVSMVGEMMAGFAHELGQPLFAISSYIDGCLIRLQREKGTPPEVLQVMSDAIDQSHRAVEVVRRLREFLRRQEIQRSQCDLNIVVRDAIQLAEVGVQRHQARCQTELADALPLAEIDRIQIMQVLLNLMLNAAEAMAESLAPERVITIRTFARDRQQVVCEVADTGPGLPMQVADAIFDAFVTTKPRGLGLGLSISRSIVDAHGGKITAANRATGPGAIFTIQLPGQNQL